MGTSILNHYSGRGEGNTSSATACLQQNCPCASLRLGGRTRAAVPTWAYSLPDSIWFRELGLILAGAEDVGDYVQVLVELNACAECAAWFTPPAHQSG